MFTMKTVKDISLSAGMEAMVRTAPLLALAGRSLPLRSTYSAGRRLPAKRADQPGKCRARPLHAR